MLNQNGDSRRFAGALGYLAVGIGYVLNQPWLMNSGSVATVPLAVFMAVLLVAVVRRRN